MNCTALLKQSKLRICLNIIQDGTDVKERFSAKPMMDILRKDTRNHRPSQASCKFDNILKQFIIYLKILHFQ